MQALQKIKVLFLCSGNSCRSQMAEGYAKKLKSDIIEPYSAGVDPRCLDPYAIMVMKEDGIDLLKQKSKHIGTLESIPFDYAVIVCSYANQFRPKLHEHTKVLFCEFADPHSLIRNARTSKDILKNYRSVRDEIRDLIESFPDFLLQEGK